jgi:hypothetical protein
MILTNFAETDQMHLRPLRRKQASIAVFYYSHFLIPASGCRAINIDCRLGTA